MTYSSGGLIQATDYNTFATNVNSTWNTYYGQTSVGSVSTGGTVTAAQWATLASTVTNAYIHQSGSNPSVASPSAGSTISIITNLSTAVTYIQTNKYNSYAFGTQTNTGTTIGAKGSTNAAWSANWTQSINFASAAARNYYFWSGGVVFLTFAKSSTGTTNDPTWNALAAACNQISFTSDSSSKVIAGVTYQGTNKQGGSGTPSNVAVSIGYNQLTTSQQQIFLQYYPTYPYTGSYIAVNAALSGNSVVFYTTWYQPASGYAFEAVNISAGARTSIYNTPPEQTYISNTWGSPTLSTSGA
jgi:hypothetical protein